MKGKDERGRPRKYEKDGKQYVLFPFLNLIGVLQLDGVKRNEKKKEKRRKKVKKKRKEMNQANIEYVHLCKRKVVLVLVYKFGPKPGEKMSEKRRKRRKEKRKKRKKEKKRKENENERERQKNIMMGHSFFIFLLHLSFILPRVSSPISPHLSLLSRFPSDPSSFAGGAKTRRGENFRSNSSSCHRKKNKNKIEEKRTQEKGVLFKTKTKKQQKEGRKLLRLKKPICLIILISYENDSS